MFAIVAAVAFSQPARTLHPSVRKSVTLQYYNAGHMFYIDVPFFKSSL
jgi:carboxypeptidase C (cathepsin A)